MSLATGTQLGPFEILAPIGAGGMGEVYRARDTRLNRDIAVKILPESVANDSARMQRFEREARVLASLNHPNIAAIYGIEQGALVLELVEGPTLAERIAQGAIPIEEALPIARQIAEALEYAHEKGIVHRDLKPANIKITPEGRVKVLDFGLAKALAGDAQTADPQSSPTLSLQATSMGTILGTAAYMSPEQAKGKPVDRRSDIWTFGVVLTEMLTSRPMYSAETVSETLATVLMKEPDLGALPAGTPSGLRQLLRRCLDRDPSRRLQAIGEARIALDELMAGGAVKEKLDAVPAVRQNRLPWALAAVFACLALATSLAWLRRPAEEARMLKFALLPPEKGTFVPISFPAISPDGRHVAFAAITGGKQQLWVHDFDSLASRLLPGTDGGTLPFWSPDSRFVAFFANNKLKKVDIAGGSTFTLCDAPAGRGGSWSRNDVIAFTPNLTAPLYRVAAAGGTAAPLTAVDQAAGEISHRFPWFLPDGRHYLFTARNSDPEKTAIYAGDLESKDRRRLLAAASNAVYSPPGFVLFMRRDRTLVAQLFDARALRTKGDPFPIAEQVDYLSPSIQGQFAVSETGALTFYSGGIQPYGQLTWVGRDGKPLGVVGSPGILTSPTISPDGGTVAVGRTDVQSGTTALWLHDLAHGTGSRFTFGSSSDEWPVWSPDGARILFTSDRDGKWSLWQKPTSGAGDAELLYQSPLLMVTTDLSRDGRFAIFQKTDPDYGQDIWVLPLSGDRKPYSFLHSPSMEMLGKLSPDARWLAYESNETGTLEIYVQSFPGKEGKWQISAKGGTFPIWSRDGKKLFYIADNKLMAVDVKSGASFEHGIPEPLFETPMRQEGFDVSPDGKRFLLITPVEDAPTPPMTVIVNWQQAVKR